MAPPSYDRSCQCRTPRMEYACIQPRRVCCVQGVFEYLHAKGIKAPEPVGLQVMVHGMVPLGAFHSWMDAQRICSSPAQLLYAGTMGVVLVTRGGCCCCCCSLGRLLTWLASCVHTQNALHL